MIDIWNYFAIVLYSPSFVLSDAILTLPFIFLTYFGLYLPYATLQFMAVHYSLRYF